MVPKIYYSKDILRTIDDAIDDGIKIYDDMYEPEKEKLAVYCMDALKDDSYTFITDSDRLDIVISQLKNLLISGGIDESLELGATLCDIAVERLDEFMPELFEERFNERTTEKYIEDGFKKIIDDQTGEERWVR